MAMNKLAAILLSSVSAIAAAQNSPTNRIPALMKGTPDLAIVVGASLSENERASVLQEYKRSDLTVRRSLVWAIGAAQDTNATEALIESLTTEFAGKQLTSGWPGKSDEEVTLIETVKVLGLLAHKSDKAYQFVLAGTEPSFWERTNEVECESPPRRNPRIDSVQH
jgi:hypothetical protein